VTAVVMGCDTQVEQKRESNPICNSINFSFFKVVTKKIVAKKVLQKKLPQICGKIFNAIKNCHKFARSRANASLHLLSLFNLFTPNFKNNKRKHLEPTKMVVWTEQ
jgi:hypothetical protein